MPNQQNNPEVVTPNSSVEAAFRSGVEKEDKQNFYIPKSSEGLGSTELHEVDKYALLRSNIESMIGNGAEITGSEPQDRINRVHHKGRILGAVIDYELSLKHDDER